MSEQEFVLNKQREAVEQNWRRYQYGQSRGHRDYTETARRLEGYYLGGQYDKDGRLQAGGHWNQADLDILEMQGRPAYEVNQIKPALDSAFGYQIANRMDIAFKPRSGDATKELAEVRSTVAMQIADNNNLHWKETDIFQDGLILQRGYLDNRIDFSDSMIGELRITALDPLDVIPDPDASSYDPADWSDVIVIRWLSIDDIAALYGADKARQVQEKVTGRFYSEYDFVSDGAERGRFGPDLYSYDYALNSEGIRVHRIIDRQHWRRARAEVAIYPSGDIRPLAGDEQPEQLMRMQQEGVIVAPHITKRVRWTVTTRDVLLFDGWSPYDRFTIVPFFPFFRHGRTRGMVDNAVGPQQILNKALSQAIHIVNTTANSGWMVEEGSLVNMTEYDLAEFGATSGTVISYRKGSNPPQKIPSNPMPQGMDRLIQLSNQFVGELTVPEAMRGIAISGNESGLAIQSRQHASQQILSVALDNLARTRSMEARWIDYAISKYYNTERVYRITRQNPLSGVTEEEELAINQPMPDGTYWNDMTAGEYDVVITEQPMQVTFENSQFQQIIEMREKGIRIPDTVVIRHSNLSDKQEIIKSMENAATPPQDPRLEAEVERIKADAERIRADVEVKKAQTTASNVKAQYAAVQTAQVIAATPETAGIADEVYASAGGQDYNAPPTFPDQIPVQGGPVTPSVQKTDMGGLAQSENADIMEGTVEPPSPNVGENRGIETLRSEDNFR